LPALRLGPDGAPRIDYGAVAALSVPLMVNNGLQVAINLTDTWFVGRISTAALAGLAAIFWVVFCSVMLIGGIGLAVQTFVAQAEGGRRRRHASRAAWNGLWGGLATLPVCALLGYAGHAVVAPFGLDDAVAYQAVAFWQPRLLGAPLTVMLWALFGFFNGIGRTRVTVFVTAFVCAANAAFNQLFIVELGWGIAGSAWATNTSMLCGVAISAGIFLRREFRERYWSHLTWRPRKVPLLRELKLGLPMGIMGSSETASMAAFSLILTRLGPIDGAATQIVMMFTSVAYLPGIGLALAGTTLVGQAIGAGDVDWARRLGTTMIALTALYMGAIGLLLALLGPALVPLFVSARDPHADLVIALGRSLVWIAAAYQVFDGLQLGTSFALRGAGDVRVPTLIFFALSWGLFVPLTYVLSFAPGQGWFEAVPQLGFGAPGGWLAMLVDVVLLAAALQWRWRSHRWQAIRLR
ncbi:MAG TPA: MATE family efflux transporter, partial [Steroidobacteraceae bacterium]|nr:MATE family efflux transporter [Steroidobacteraceae bacterium]